ncbi:MAG: DUF5777 family beta-barrel protein [Maribacter sp.]|nr:DUF5777 family beta-barrel protein [Maribacter sp.]
MKNYKILLFAFLILPFWAISQEKEKDSVQVEDKPERPAFESSYIIDNPTNVLYSKNTLEIQMQHRFGIIKDADLAGIWGDANIRLGLAYSIIDRVTVGFGTTKDNRFQDFNLKVGLLSQTRSGKIPVSVSYYGNVTIDARKKGFNRFPTVQARYSYFNQLIIARRFSPKLSLQLAPSVSHFNLVEPERNNDMFAMALGGRYKVSENTAVLFDYSQPFTQYYVYNSAYDDFYYPKPGISLGVEFSTSGHAFQLFLTNNSGIVPQQNYMKNTNDFFNGEFMLGFNITRIYNF